MTIHIEVQGNLGQSPELRPVASDKSSEPSLVLNFSIASSRFKKNEEGRLETVGDPEWVNCEYWNRDAAHLHKLLQKGMPVFVKGEEIQESYTDRDGNLVKARKVRVQQIYLGLTKRIENIVLRPKREQQPGEQNGNPDDSDIPF